MADVEIVIKDIKYSFEHNECYDRAYKEAVATAEGNYLDEQIYRNNEYEELQKNGTVSNRDEYRELVGDDAYSVDYSKPFEENLSHPTIVKEIEETTNRYMCNLYDLPTNLVITVDENYVDSQWNPDESVIRKAIKEKFGEDVSFQSYSRAAKAEQKDIYSQLAYDKIGEMIKSNDYQAYLDLRATIGKYSSGNISLIYCQNPKAKAVMGFKAWKKQGRHVTQGSKSLKIWSPVEKDLTNEKQVDDYIKNYCYLSPNDAQLKKAELMKEIEDSDSHKTTVICGFTLVPVFDISSTVSNDPEHDNRDDIMNLNKPLNADLNNYKEVKLAIKEATAMRGDASVPMFVVEDDNQSHQDALFQAAEIYADKLLTLYPDSVRGIKSRIPLTGDMHKIETIMSAYLICKHIGVESIDKAGFKLSEIFDNSSTQNVRIGKRKMYLDAFDRACHVSDQFAKAFDERYAEIIKYDEIYTKFTENLSRMYEHLYANEVDDNEVSALVDSGQTILVKHTEDTECILRRYLAEKDDWFTSDREVAALALATVASGIPTKLDSKQIQHIKQYIDNGINKGTIGKIDNQPSVKRSAAVER